MPISDSIIRINSLELYVPDPEWSARASRGASGNEQLTSRCRVSSPVYTVDAYKTH